MILYVLLGVLFVCFLGASYTTPLILTIVDDMVDSNWFTDLVTNVIIATVWLMVFATLVFWIPNF